MNSKMMIVGMVATLVSGVAHADDQNLVYGNYSEPETKVELKSPAMATGLSVGGFLFPAIMVAILNSESSGGGENPLGAVVITTGILLGPGLGHAYAGNTGRFWKGAGLRTLGFGGVIAAAASSWDDSDPGASVNVLAVMSAALYLGSSIFDMVTADNSAKAHNERLAASNVSISPTWDPEDDAVGLALAMRF